MKDDQQIEKIRHSISHLMSMAIMELYPKAGLGVGPFIENGFYQDYDLPESISEEIFPKLEKRIKEMIKQDIEFKQHNMDFAEALKLYKHDPYKTELIEDLKKAGEKNVSFYQSDWFENLCKGPHVKSTKEINPEAFKLTSIAGAYWRGSEKNKMLTRIYGLAFSTKKELDDYLAMLEEAKKRDHRRLGKELDLFTFSELIGSGLPLYTPKGTFIRKSLNDYVESMQIKSDYTQVWTPQIAKASLFKTSGHYDKYKDDMFRVISNYSDEEFFLKPMNCPQHTQIYLSQPRSYRDLPLRYTDFAMLYRDEKPGELNGLARVRSFSQDDCHIFCREDQVDEEIDIALNMTKEILATFGLSYRYRLSTRDPAHPEKYLGDPKIWDKVEAWAEKIMKKNKIEYFPGPGEAAFYAPKMDLIATDALGREWQLSTVQIDYVMPERFGLEYTDSDGQKKRPIMLHRAIIGSTERFMMIILEHLAGNLPLWLSPVQVKILNVGSDHENFCKQLANEFKARDLRVNLDLANETIGNKIRKSSAEKIPYTLVIGDKEMSGGPLAVRVRGQKDMINVTKDQFLKKLAENIVDKKLPL